MKKQNNINRGMRFIAAAAIFLTGVLCAHAERIVDSAWDSGLDGWIAEGPAVVTNTIGCLSIAFPGQTAPAYSAATLTKQVPSGYRPYLVSFRFKAPALLPSSVRVYIRSASGRSWYKPLPVNVVGEWLTLNTLVKYESGWILGPSGSREDFESDMNSITEVSVLLVRNGSPKAHDFLIDDFVLEAVPSGGDLPSDSDGDGMNDAWETANGLDPANPADAALDADNDGLTNIQEFLAGTGPRDASSVLALTIEDALTDGGQSGFVLMWSSVAGRYYQVWRATNLVAGFEMLEGGILATPPVNVYVDSAAPSNGSSFYRIDLE